MVNGQAQVEDDQEARRSSVGAATSGCCGLHLACEPSVDSSLDVSYEVAPERPTRSWVPGRALRNRSRQKEGRSAMTLTPSLPEPIHVICFCACSFLHPKQKNICDADNPKEVTVLATSMVPICEPCAQACNVPLPANDDPERE